MGIWDSIFGKDCPFDNSLIDPSDYNNQSLLPRHVNYRNHPYHQMQAQAQQNALHNAIHDASIYGQGFWGIGQMQGPEPFHKNKNHPYELSFESPHGKAASAITKINDLGIDFSVYCKSNYAGPHYHASENLYVVCVATEEDANLIKLSIDGVKEVYVRIS